MKIDPDVVYELGKQVWRSSDELAAMHIDSAFMTAAAGCQGSDLQSGLSRRAHEQQEYLRSMASHLDSLGSRIKSAADELRRADDEAASDINRIRH